MILYQFKLTIRYKLEILVQESKEQNYISLFPMLFCHEIKTSIDKMKSPYNTPCHPVVMKNSLCKSPRAKSIMETKGTLLISADT